MTSTMLDFDFSPFLPTAADAIANDQKAGELQTENHEPDRGFCTVRQCMD
jgi:hypothetical protein